MECYLYRFPPSGGEAVVCRRLPPSMSLQNVLLHQSCPKTEDDRKLLYTLKNSVRAEWLQSCPTLCNPLDCSPSGSSIHGTLQARIVEWTVMPSSRGSSQLRDRTQVSCIAGGFFRTKALFFLLTKHNLKILLDCVIPASHSGKCQDDICPVIIFVVQKIQ